MKMYNTLREKYTKVKARNQDLETTITDMKENSKKDNKKIMKLQAKLAEFKIKDIQTNSIISKFSLEAATIQSSIPSLQLTCKESN